MKVSPALFDGLENKDCETFMRLFTEKAWNDRPHSDWTWWDNFSDVKFTFSIHRPFSKYSPTPSISFVNHMANEKKITIPLCDEYATSDHFHHRIPGYILVKNLNLVKIFERTITKIIKEQRQFLHREAKTPQQLVEHAMYKDAFSDFPTTRKLVAEIQRKKLHKISGQTQTSPKISHVL